MFASHGKSFYEGDVITMIYNPFKSTLVFEINDKKKGIIGIYMVMHPIISTCSLYGIEGTQIVELIE